MTPDGGKESEPPIPPFSGVDTDVPVERFIAAVDQIANSLKWSESTTAAKAAKALTGQAEVWFENLIKEASQVADDWPLLKSKLQQQFGNLQSLSERVKDLQNLKQKGKETSEDFYDRVSAKLYSLEHEILDSAEGESERKAMIRLVKPVFKFLK